MEPNLVHFKWSCRVNGHSLKFNFNLKWVKALQSAGREEIDVVG